MKIRAILIFLLFSGWSFGLNAQQKTSFPITGTFKLQGAERDFNKVVIASDGYSVLMNDKVIRSYKIQSKTAEGYEVEQYFEGNQKRDRARFVVRLDKENADDCFISVIYGGYTEKIHLVRMK